MKKILFFILAITVCAPAQNNSALNIAQRIADRVIGETSFKFITVKQKPALDLQVIDFNSAFKQKKGSIAYALSIISVKEDMNLYFGISYKYPVTVWINDKIVFNGKKQSKFIFKEIAYSMFVYNDSFKVNLNKGKNRIVIESENVDRPFVYLREITLPETNPVSSFLPAYAGVKEYTWPWCFFTTNREEGSRIFPRELFEKLSKDESDFVFLRENTEKKLFISPENTFKKDSYADWNYPNGILMMTMSELSGATVNQKYKKFAEKYCNFIENNSAEFKKQYYEDHNIRGSFYRMCRKGMLDDAGAPVLPFAEIELIESNKDYSDLVDEMVNYVMDEQSRLPDGILCRPEPEKWTVWCDDLFMSVPLLVRAGKLYKKNKYFDEAAKQIIGFNKYLFVNESGLYKHGWFSKNNFKSKVFWGRANGWVVWAETEALKYIPQDNKYYPEIESIYKKHIAGIFACQGADGMWHQVLK